jgi:excinuclease ABC subunit A
VGTPETVAKCEESYTGHYLAQALLQYPPKKQDNIREEHRDNKANDQD